MTNTTRLHSASRLSSATGIDTARPIDFTVDGATYSGFAGDTIASALIAAGRIDCGNSTYLGRARGILGAGVEESNALVRRSEERRVGRAGRSGAVPSGST